jgi:hydrogenase assembly chaperone HypC/HupF
MIGPVPLENTVMCLAHPMKIIERQTVTRAICARLDGSRHEVDLSFLPDVEVGTWVTVHLGLARDVTTEEDAHQIEDALRALDMVKAGETDIDHLFADLVGREPQRPGS